MSNQDTYGRWHVSCSYLFQQSAKGTLINSNIQQMLEETMVGLSKFYPTNSLVATFGAIESDLYYTLPGARSVMINEFGFWNKQLTKAELVNYRLADLDRQFSY